MKAAYFATFCAIFSAVTTGQAADDLKTFPPAEQGVARYVLPASGARGSDLLISAED